MTKMEMKKQAFLVLEDGTALKGFSFGAIKSTSGEVGKFFHYH